MTERSVLGTRRLLIRLSCCSQTIPVEFSTLLEDPPTKPRSRHRFPVLVYQTRMSRSLTSQQVGSRTLCSGGVATQLEIFFFRRRDHSGPLTPRSVSLWDATTFTLIRRINGPQKGGPIR